MLMILARLVRSESFWAVAKVRSPHTGPGIRYIVVQACSAIICSFCFRYIVGNVRHRAHTESQREESGESQFLGSLWRATLSREAWMPIWGLSTESDFASPSL